MPSKALEDYLDNIIGDNNEIKEMPEKQRTKHLLKYYTAKAYEDLENSKGDS